MTAHAYRDEEQNPAAVASGEVRPEADWDERRRMHKERFRASLAWALEEYSSTLEKLSK
jgi:hypothetical protein